MAVLFHVSQIHPHSENKMLYHAATNTSFGRYTKDQSFRPFPLHDVIRVVEAHLLDSNGNPRADLPPNESSDE